MISRYEFDIPRVTYTENLLTLIVKIALASPLCAVSAICYLKTCGIHSNDFRTSVQALMIESILKLIKRNSVFFEEYLEIFNFINNIWLIVEEKDLVKGLKRIFKCEEDLFRGLRIPLNPKFCINFLSFDIKSISNKEYFLMKDLKGKEKFVGFRDKIRDLKPISLIFVVRIMVNYLKKKNLATLIKVPKVDVTWNRNKGELGMVIEVVEHGPYDEREIVESLACYKLMMFLFGVKQRNQQIFVCKQKKVILNYSKFLPCEKHYRYFSISNKKDLNKFRYWVITFYIQLRGIFDTILWMMNEDFWRGYKIHFYNSLPVQNAVIKLRNRINKNNATL